MKEQVYQIKIDFHVTPHIKRYVYVYLIVGEKGCYLIDTGVAGAEQKIEKYLNQVGKKWEDIKAVFLTHAHPDHIGSAASIRESTGCMIYASEGESRWIEDINLQFRERPIPNFYQLVNRSVVVDHKINSEERIVLEPGITIRTVSTPGHSCDEMSYLWEEERCIFIGDTIPVRGDIPIWINEADNMASLGKLHEMKKIDMFYPAWDVSYERSEAMQKIDDALEWMSILKEQVKISAKEQEDLDEIVLDICDRMKTKQYLMNPLFKRTIDSMRGKGESYESLSGN